jgi:hypothetical protein
MDIVKKIVFIILLKVLHRVGTRVNPIGTEL